MRLGSGAGRPPAGLANRKASRGRSGKDRALPLPYSEGSLAWFYWLAAAWIAAAAILPLVTPVRLILIAVFWVVYGHFFLNNPERLPALVILGVQLIVLRPWRRTGIPMADAWTVFLVTMVIAAIVYQRRQPKPSPPNKLFRPVAYNGALLSISATVSYLTGSALYHTHERGWYEFSAWTIFSRVRLLVLLPFLAPLSFRVMWSRSHVRTVVHVSAILTLVLALESIWSYREFIFSGKISLATRAEGLLREPNAFGGFLALTIVLLVPLLLDAKLLPLERVLFATTVGAATAAVTATLSRSAWLAMIVALGYIAVSRGAKAIVAMLVLALTATLWMPQSVIDRATSTVKEDLTWEREAFESDGIDLEGSAEGRVEHWSRMPEQLASSPLYGHGFLSYFRMHRQLNRAGDAVPAHSPIIEWTVEEGLLGLAAYIGLIWVLSYGARGILRLGKEKDPDRFFHPLASGMIAAVIALVLMDMTAARLKNPFVMTKMWVLAGGLARLYWTMKASGESATAGSESRRGRTPTGVRREGVTRTPV